MGKKVDVSNCPRCGGILQKTHDSENIFKCTNRCLLRLEFESDIRGIERGERAIWIDQEGKEYPATMKNDHQ